jgi:hypothetical protein
VGHAYDPARWYFVVKCEECGEIIPLAVAPSPEQEPRPKTYATLVPCPRCHVEGAYRSGQIERRRGEAGSPGPAAAMEM